MTFKTHHIRLHDHPLLGTIVRVDALVFTENPEREVVNPLEPDGLMLTYDDGRKVIIEDVGPETNGLAVVAFKS